MNNVSMIGIVSGVPRAERDGARAWAVLSLLVPSGDDVERFEVIAEGRAREVVVERQPEFDCRLAIDGRLGRGPGGGVVIIAEHALWLSALDLRRLEETVRTVRG